MLSIYGTEQVGISVEVALADLSGVAINQSYRARAKPELIEHVGPGLERYLNSFPKPIKHIAEDQNPIDFLLEGSKTLSVKSNMKKAGKVAPQNIGQPTATTFWSRLPQLVPVGVNVNLLSYEESALLFKSVAQGRIIELLGEYWKNLFDCDYTVYVYNVLNDADELTAEPSVKVFKKIDSPGWKESWVSFSRPLGKWNESCTVKYQDISIGEFQVHNNRNCFKFRFNLAGLIQSGLL